MHLDGCLAITQPSQAWRDCSIVFLPYGVLLMVLYMCRLNDPTATLFGFDSSFQKQQAVIVSLASPVADIAAKVRS